MVVVVVLKDELEQTFVLKEELVEGVFKSQVHYDVQ